MSKRHPAIRDSYAQGHVQRRVDQLRVGDRVDLQNDQFADPEGFRQVESQHPEFEFDFQTVTNIEKESRRCIRVDFENFSCGFPPRHWVDVDAEQVR